MRTLGAAVPGVLIGLVAGLQRPRGVVSAGRLSRATYREMPQNLWWAAAYNVVAIPLAAGALAWAGLVLPMASVRC